MKHVDPDLALLPLKKNWDLFTILSSPSFPTKFELLQNCPTISHFESKSAKVHVYIQPTKGFNKVKSNPFVNVYLQKF